MDLGFTQKELKSAIEQIIQNPDKMLDIFRYSEIMDIPELRVRYINTPGGMQLCLKSVNYRGEASGVYMYPIELTSFIELILRRVTRLRESSLRIQKLLTAKGQKIHMNANGEVAVPTYQLKIQARQ